MKRNAQIKMLLYCKWPVTNLGEVSVVTGQAEIEFCALVVNDNPRIDRVLIEVIVSTACHRIEIHEIVKV